MIQRVSFSEIIKQKGLDREWDIRRQKLDHIRPEDVERAIYERPGRYSTEKLAALISPAARDYLEQMAQAAAELTIQRFGKTITLYAPVYISSYCCNECLYCGFNRGNKIQRCRLSIGEVLKDADVIAKEGFRDILLVSSEDREFVTTDYIAKLSKKLREKFSSIAIEIYQLSRDEYAELFKAGVNGVTLYQETYNREVYRRYHRSGPKADYEKRLRGPEDIAAAGMREIGLGALLGLGDWRIETLGLAEHADYLMKHFWKSRVSFSFPRLRPAQDMDSGQFQMLTDTDLVQMMLALRLCFADAGLVLSTRESQQLRDRLVGLGITKISAGSKTNPGGYTDGTDTLEQFEVADTRMAADVAEALREKGYEPVWKDWDSAYTKI